MYTHKIGSVSYAHSFLNSLKIKTIIRPVFKLVALMWTGDVFLKLIHHLQCKTGTNSDARFLKFGITIVK